jgi:WD repeat-containing protein 48
MAASSSSGGGASGGARRREPRLTYLLRSPETAAAHCAGVNALRLSPDNRLLFTASRDGTVRRWPVGPGSGVGSGAPPAPDALLEGHTDWVNALAWLPGGVLASASCDGTLRLWRATGSAVATAAASPCLAVLRQHKDYVTSLAAAPGAPVFASGGLGGEVWLWDANTAQALASLPPGATPAPPAAAPGARASVYALALGGAGEASNLLVAGGAEHVLRLWDARAPGAAAAGALRGHTDTVRAALLDGAGMRCLSAGSDRQLRLWDLRQRRLLHAFPAAHSDSVWALAADDALATAWSGGRDGALWATPLGVAGGEAVRAAVRVAAPRDAPPVTALALDGGAGIWVGTTASSVARWPRDAAAAASPAGGVRDSSGGATSASSSVMSSPGFRGVRPPAPPLHASPAAVLPGAPGLRRAEVLPDRRRILTQDTSGALFVWDLAAGAPGAPLPRGTGFDAARARLAERIAAPPWFTADTRTGCLAVHLDCPGAFAAESYAADVGMAGAPDDLKVNLGQQALLCVLGPWARKRAAAEATAAAAEAALRGEDAPPPPPPPPPSAFAFPSPPPLLIFDAPDGARQRWDASALSGSDAEAAALPGWAVDAVLRGALPVGEAPKLAFSLRPADGCGLPPLAQPKLSAPRILRAAKIVTFLASKLELPGGDGGGDGGDGGGGDAEGAGAEADAEAPLALFCNGAPVPMDMSLASAAAFLWKRQEDLVIHYAPRATGVTATRDV